MTDNLDERLAEISARIDQGEQPATSVRNLLSWVGAKRRGTWISWRIREGLAGAGLVTHPDFEEVWIDEDVDFLRLTQPPETGSASNEDLIQVEVITTAEPDRLIDSLQSASYRISRLAAANTAPQCVAPDASLAEAVTIMLTHDYSQLPVMTGERDVKGVISWRSIAQRTTLGRTGKLVKDFMDDAIEERSSATVFKVMSHLTEHDYVLVRGADRRITGLITSTDLTEQFRQWTEPFLLISEVEHSLRILIDRAFSVSEMEAVRDPEDKKRTIRAAADLNFGDYIRLLEREDHWNRLKLSLDRKTFVAMLERVRQTRNEVMHFDPDGLDDESRSQLRDAFSFFERLRELGSLG